MNTDKRNRTWLAVVLVVAVIGILALIAIPNFVRDPWTSPASACINNLREIDGAKERWVLERHAKTNDVVTFERH
jgi:Tfp pilus assembly protein PilE